MKNQPLRVSFVVVRPRIDYLIAVPGNSIVGRRVVCYRPGLATRAEQENEDSRCQTHTSNPILRRQTGNSNAQTHKTILGDRQKKPKPVELNDGIRTQ